MNILKTALLLAALLNGAIALAELNTQPHTEPGAGHDAEAGSDEQGHDGGCIGGVARASGTP